jgi:hypothetical protein
LRGMQHEASEAISWKLAVCTLIILVWFVHLFHAHWIRHTFSIFQLLARLLILHSCLLEVGVCSDKRCRISPRLLHHQLGADLDKYPRSTVVVARHKQTWKAQNLLTYSTDTYTSCHVSSSILKKGTRGLSIQAGCWSTWIRQVGRSLIRSVDPNDHRLDFRYQQGTRMPPASPRWAQVSQLSHPSLVSWQARFSKHIESLRVIY